MTGPVVSAPRGLAVPLVLGCLAMVLLLSLGTWQIRRRAWKHDLIARTERNLHAAPVAPPPPRLWSRIGQADAYRRVTMGGTYRRGLDTLVQAVTVQGAGFWVLTPFRQGDGGTILVNRGFVPADRTGAAGGRLPVGSTKVTGLLRLTEPGGGFLRRNDPAGGRWFSRDVAAIARARHLGPVAPFFIDADAGPGGGTGPVGGLTVIAFSDNHLLYATIWYALAAMTAWGLVLLVRLRRADWIGAPPAPSDTGGPPGP